MNEMKRAVLAVVVALIVAEGMIDLGAKLNNGLVCLASLPVMLLTLVSITSGREMWGDFKKGWNAKD